MNDTGNHILEAQELKIQDPAALERELNQIAAKEVDDAYWTRPRLTEVAYAVEGNGHIPLYQAESRPRRPGA